MFVSDVAVSRREHFVAKRRRAACFPDPACFRSTASIQSRYTIRAGGTSPPPSSSRDRALNACRHPDARARNRRS